MSSTKYYNSEFFMGDQVTSTYTDHHGGTHTITGTVLAVSEDGSQILVGVEQGFVVDAQKRYNALVDSADTQLLEPTKIKGA